MPFYLSEYIGSGKRKDPFRPVGSDQPGWSAIDLRADGGATLDGNGFGKCLLHVPEPFKNSRAKKLGDDKLDSLSARRRDSLTSLLRTDLSRPKLLRDVVATMMVRPHADAWSPILPSWLRWEIWLGELLWSAPRISGGASDDFNRPNETLAAAGGWTKIGGNDFVIASNQMKSSGSDADSIWVYPGAASGSDQFVECTTTTLAVADGGPVVRGQASSGLCGYVLAMAVSEIAKFMTGSFTTVSVISYSTDTNPGDSFGLSAVGTTLTGYHTVTGPYGGSNPTTDTAIPGTGGTGAGQPGFFWFEVTNTINAWKGGDYGKVAVAFPVVADNDDGTIYREAATWAGIGSGTATAESTTELWISKAFNTPNYDEDVTLLEIDTSGLPDMATVVHADLKAYVLTNKQNANSFNVVADYYHFGGEPSVAADWTQTSDPSILDPTTVGSFTASAWNTMGIKEVGGINKFGYTGIRLTLDDAATPTGSNWLEFASSERSEPPFTLDIDYVLEGHWARDQARSDNRPASNPTLAFPNDIKAGSLLIIAIDGGDTSPGPPSDTRGNVWTSIRGTNTVNTQRIQWWYAISKDAGPCTVTFSSFSFQGYSVAEFSTDLAGTITLDVEDTVYRSTTGAGTDKFNTASVTASAADSLAISFVGTDTNTNADVAAGTNCFLDTQGALDSGAVNDRVAMEHKIVGAGSVALPWTTTGDFNGQVHVAVFKASVAATPTYGGSPRRGLASVA